MKIINFFINNKRQIVLGLFAFLIFTGFTVTFSNLFNQEATFKDPEPKIDLNTVYKIKTATNYRALKVKAFDSLIDNNLFTVENIAKIDSIYPDSLCHCGDQFLDSIIKGLK